MAPAGARRGAGRAGARAGLLAALAGRASRASVVVDQGRRLTIVNGCASAPIWIAHIAGNGTIPDPQNARIDPGASRAFSTGSSFSAARYWPKMGCDAAGNDCGVGGSGGPDQGCVANTPDYSSCAPPIDSKFEATWGQEGETCGTDMAGCDYVDMSLVDGFTLPFKLDISGQCSAAGVISDVQSIDCSRLSPEICPDHETLDAVGQTVSLRAVNPKTGKIAGCYSPCKKLTDPKWNNVLGTHDDADPGVSKYCCPTPPEEPDVCRVGPIKDTAWLSVVHNFCPGVYAYAYDDGVGLLQCDATSTYKLTFYCPHEAALTTSPQPLPVPVAQPVEQAPANPLQAIAFHLQAALASLRSRLVRADDLEAQAGLREGLGGAGAPPARSAGALPAAAGALPAAAALLLAAAALRGRARRAAPAGEGLARAPREGSQDDEGSQPLMHSQRQPPRGGA